MKAEDVQKVGVVGCGLMGSGIVEVCARAGLQVANESFDDAAASFQTRVRPAGERLAELGGGVEGKDLAELTSLESASRLPTN